MSIDTSKYILSTGTHYISNSGSDENKAYHSGKAGDQTGYEWELKPWYNRPWSCVLRHPDQVVAKLIAELGIAAALNDKIGYDQYQRTTYWTQLKAAGYDPSKITEACEEDCTAGVSSNVKAVGFLLGIPVLQNVSICTSRNMRSVFSNAGFKVLTDSKYLTSPKYLLPGDILLYENHHAATNVTCGTAVRRDWNPDATSAPSGAVITPTEKEEALIEVTAPVNIRLGPGTSYKSVAIAKKSDRLPYFGFTFPNGWLLVEHNCQLCAVSGKYGRVVE